jgi:tetratricopeptide (TPR) repeat protein
MRYSAYLPISLITASIVLIAPQQAKAISSAEVAQIAESITVKLENTNTRSRGSGLILKKDGDTYYVLTAFHVVRGAGKYTLTAPDGKEYQINYKTVKKGTNVDLAILQFTSSNTYKTAKIGNSDKSTLGTTSYVAGFPAPTAAFPVSALRFLEGKITANASIQVDDGYTLVYSNSTLGGMSGGPVFNEQGEVIAVHGRAETVSDGNKDNPKPISSGNNLGIPINTFLRLAMLDVGVKAPATVVAKEPKADDFYVEGNGKYEKGDYRGAVASYTKAIEINAEYVEAYNNRGIAYSNLGDTQKAILDFNRAIEINPQLAKVYYNRGVVYRSELADYQKAILDFNQAIAFDPKYAKAYSERGYAYSRLGDTQKAISDLNEAIALDPTYAGAYHNRGIAYSDSGEYQKAISDLNQAIALDPKYAETYFIRGRVYEELGEYQKAISDFNQAIALDSKDILAYIERGNVYLKSKDYRKAISDFNQVLGFNFKLFDTEVYNSRGLAYFNLGNYQKAKLDFNQAIALNSKLADAYKNRGNAYRKLGDKQKALADFTQAAKLYQEQGKTSDYQDALNRIRELR